jgi:hypothetical protein
MLPFPVLPVLMQVQAIYILIEAQRLLLNEFISLARVFQIVAEESGNVVQHMAKLSTKPPRINAPQLKT